VKTPKKRKVHKSSEQTEAKPSPRNRALHIPLDFEQAVEGLLNVKPKPKKKQPKK
jgi:hypothetical protein